MLRLFSTGYEYRNNKNVIYFSEYNNMVISKGKTAFFMLIKVDKYTSLCRIGNTQHYQQAMHILFHNIDVVTDNTTCEMVIRTCYC